MRRSIFILSVLSVFMACSQKPSADLLLYNGTIYTVDSSYSKAEAMLIKDGKILAVGNKADLENKYAIKEKLDARGKFIYPGFIDAHAHFVGYGSGLLTVDLTGTTSWEEVIQRVTAFVKKNPDPASWIIGRGWDQNDWDKEEFPDNSRLNELFPQRPVILQRVDGHAAIANQAALDLGNVRAGMQLEGGSVETKKNLLTGILIDNAVDIVTRVIPPLSSQQYALSLMEAEKNCLAVGLTTVDDCGLGFKDVETIRQLQSEGKLNMRLYVMLSDDLENFNWLKKNGMIKTDQLNVRSIKVYADGALGSRGACLLAPYQDKPGWSGFLLKSQAHFDSVAAMIYQQGWQMCTHAIGDSGNRTILNIYGKYLKEKNDRRWRIEHAQVVNSNDLELFGKYTVVPSVQPTHATSDMYWAEVRLGAERIKGAYAYQQLMQQNGWIPLGTDFPVEDISPIKTFYAAVIRKDAKGWPKNGYQVENALSREQAIRGMTIWAARANFEETEKGSLEKGKLADFVILDRDLMNASEKELINTKVLSTYIGGKKRF